MAHLVEITGATWNAFRLSRTLGALLGVHTGDSLGATLEFMSWDQIKQQYPNGLRSIVGGGSFDWPVGAATDDTDLTRAVLLAYRDLYENRMGVDPPVPDFDLIGAVAKNSLKWYEGDWPGRKLGTRPVDIGGATHTALSKYQRTRDYTRSGAGKGSAGNGSLMRCIPTGLFSANSQSIRSESLAISKITHDDQRCMIACAVYNEMVHAMVSGKSAQEAVDIGTRVADEMADPDVAAAIEQAKTTSIAEIASEGPSGILSRPHSGYVLHSLRLAVAALLDPRSFEDVLVDVTRIGGDTDTNGAIAGGLLGARDGIEAIPTAWLEKLQFRDEFEQVARRICELKNQ